MDDHLLHELRTAIDELRASMGSLVTSIAMDKVERQYQTAALQKLQTDLIGNGDAGMIIRLDRLEQKQAARSKQFYILYGAILTLAVNALWRWLH